MLPESEAAKCLLAVLGLLWVARWVVYLACDVLGGLRKFVWARVWEEDLPATYGKWAVVTGCTDGIGKEYARELASRDMHVLLIARNIHKLTDLQRVIKEESPGVMTEVVLVDFSDGTGVYDKIAPFLHDKDVGILVNNVGVNIKPPRPFKDVSEEDLWPLIHVNVASVVGMTRLVLDGMLAKGKGAIINIGSAASGNPLPRAGVYAATKAFVDFFSQSLAWECRGTGVTIQTVRPGFVSTKMINSYTKAFTKPRLLVPSSSTFVASALPTLGHSDYTSGYWIHGCQQFVMEKVMNRTLVAMWYERHVDRTLRDDDKED